MKQTLKHYVIFTVAMVGILSVIGFVIFWHLVNGNLPTGDEIDYLLHSYGHYRAFDDGVINGLRSLYMDRLWKTIAIPVFHVPFLFLTGGKILPSLFLQSLAISFIMIFLLFKIFRTHLGRAESWLGVALLITNPWFMDTLLGLNAENYELIACFICFLAMLRLENQKTSLPWSTTYSLGLFLNLISRPFEMGYFFFLDVLKRAALFYKSSPHWATLLGLLLASPPFLLVLGSIYLFFHPDLLPTKGPFLYLLLLLAFVLWLSGASFIYKKVSRARPYLLQILPMALLFTLYYMFHGTELIGWIRECLFGPLATVGGGRDGRNLFQILLSLGYHLFYPLLIPIVFAAGAYVCLRKKPTAALNTLIYSMVPLVLIPLFTDNTATRYFFPMALVLMIVTHIVLWSYTNLFTWIGRAVFVWSMLHHVQLIGAIIDPAFPLYDFIGHHGYTRGFSLPPDPNAVFTKSLINHFEKFKPPHERIKIGLIRAKASEDDFLFGFWGLRLTFLERNLHFYIDSPYGFDSSGVLPMEAILKSSLENFDYLVVGKMDEAIESRLEPDTLVAKHLNDLRQQNRLDTLPLIYEGDIKAVDDRGYTLEFMVFKVKH